MPKEQDNRQLRLKAHSMLSNKPPKLTLHERKRMKNNIQMTLTMRAQEEQKTGKIKRELEKQLEEEKQATRIVKKEMMTQKELL